MNTKAILIWAGAIIATFVLLFVVYSFTNTPNQSDYSEINKVRTDDHTSWSKDSKNLLVEYSDIQCPACKGFHDLFKTFEASSSPDFVITKKVTLIFRHFPLFSIHLNSMSAAYAAEAASKQNKFWEMTNALYDQQTSWSSLANPKEYFINVAKQLKLDTVQFTKDFDSQAVKDRVQANINEGNKYGVDATPTFFLNGKKVNVNSFDEFKNTLKSL